MQIFEVKTASGGRKNQNSVRKMVWGPIFQGKVEAGKIGSESPNAREGIKTWFSRQSVYQTIVLIRQNHQMPERALRPCVYDHALIANQKVRITKCPRGH